MPQRRVVFLLGISKMKQVVLPYRANRLLQKHVMEFQVKARGSLAQANLTLKLLILMNNESYLVHKHSNDNRLQGYHYLICK